MAVTRSLVCLVAIAVAGSAAPADAVDKDTCLPTAEMVTRLRAEGQRSVVEGNLLTWIEPGPHPRMIYTANATGSRGYQVLAYRQGTDTTPVRMCVKAVLTDIRLNDHRRHRQNRGFYVVSQPEEVLLRNYRADGHDMSRRPRGHNAALDFFATQGSYPMLQAIQWDGDEPLIITVVGNLLSREESTVPYEGRTIWTTRSIAFLQYDHDNLVFVQEGVARLGQTGLWPANQPSEPRRWSSLRR